MYCFWLVFGVTGLCLGDTMYMVSLSLVGVSRAVPIGCVDTPFTMLFATLFFNEQVTLLLLMGATLIVVDIWLVSQDGNKSNNMTREVFAMFLSLFLEFFISWNMSRFIFLS